MLQEKSSVMQTRSQCSRSDFCRRREAMGTRMERDVPFLKNELKIAVDVIISFVLSSPLPLVANKHIPTTLSGNP